MARRKKETIEKSEAKDAFTNCMIYTQDQVRNALVEICRSEDITDETAARLTAVVDGVIANSISKVMASSGF
tara:strand:- start:530 stop:745 length:216 start_codon:yes stop_codon:yes gene_type:complete